MENTSYTTTIDFAADACVMAKAMHDIVIAKSPSTPMLIDGKVHRSSADEAAFVNERVFLECWCQILAALRDDHGLDLGIQQASNLLGMALLVRVCAPDGLLADLPAAKAMHLEMMGAANSTLHERQLAFGYRTMVLARALQSHQAAPGHAMRLRDWPKEDDAFEERRARRRSEEGDEGEDVEDDWNV